jgi:hypothetical protein
MLPGFLRKIAHGEADSLGDTSTLADPTVVEFLISAFAKKNIPCK